MFEWTPLEDSQKPNKHDLVLFNENKFKEQWKGRNPILNWYYIKSNYQLKKIKSYPYNWELYEIE